MGWSPTGLGDIGLIDQDARLGLIDQDALLVRPQIRTLYQLEAERLDKVQVHAQALRPEWCDPHRAISSLVAKAFPLLGNATYS